MNEYHSDLFNRISEEKKNRIYHTASMEFSKIGYQAANINLIAQKAGVSVGSLYKYFGTKENLFLATVEKGKEQLEEVFSYIGSFNGSFRQKIKEILKIIQTHSMGNPELINLYNEFTSEGNAVLAKKLSGELESMSARFYTEMIKEAQESGEIGNKSDPRYLAFFLDNLFLTLQFSYASAYYKERMNLFLKDCDIDDPVVVDRLLDFICNSLGIGE